MSVNFRFDLVPARTDGAGQLVKNPASYSCPIGMNTLIATYGVYRKAPTVGELRYASRRAANFSQPHVLIASQYILDRRDYVPYAVFTLLAGEL